MWIIQVSVQQIATIVGLRHRGGVYTHSAYFPGMHVVASFKTRGIMAVVFEKTWNSISPLGEADGVP